MTAPTQPFDAASVASHAIMDAAIAEAHRAFAAAHDALIAARPPASGTAEMDAIARAERAAVAELQRRRDDAIRQAEEEHRDRLAAAARHYGTYTDTHGDPEAPHAVAWLVGLEPTNA